MGDEKATSPSPSSGVTVWHLGLMVSFVMPIAAVFEEIQSAGGGVARYLTGEAFAVCLACAVAIANWKMLNSASRWARMRSGRYQNLLGMAMFGAELAAGVCSCILAYWLVSVWIGAR
jgi:hypothetical protein